MDIESALNIELVSIDDIPAIKLFLKVQVGMDDTFGYTENLVSRKEIFMVKESDVIIATSEWRMQLQERPLKNRAFIAPISFLTCVLLIRAFQVQLRQC